MFTSKAVTQARATTVLLLFNLIQMTAVLSFAHYFRVKVGAVFNKLIASYMLIKLGVLPWVLHFSYFKISFKCKFFGCWSCQMVFYPRSEYATFTDHWNDSSIKQLCCWVKITGSQKN